MLYLHDICDQKLEAIEYRRRRRREVEEEERERVLDAWHWMFVTAMVIGMAAGAGLWFFDPLVRVLALLGGCAATIFKYKSSRTVDAQRQSFLLLLTTLISGLTLLFFICSF